MCLPQTQYRNMLCQMQKDDNVSSTSLKRLPLKAVILGNRDSEHVRILYYLKYMIDDGCAEENCLCIMYKKQKPIYIMPFLYRFV